MMWDMYTGEVPAFNSRFIFWHIFCRENKIIGFLYGTQMHLVYSFGRYGSNFESVIS